MFFERPSASKSTRESKPQNNEASSERAVIVHINFHRESDNEQLDEFLDLVRSANAEPVAIVRGNRNRPEPKYFVGTGKAEEIKMAVQAHDADVVLINHAISPAQERNIENLIQCRVLDRTTVILDIFAQRARSHEGKLQVELAQLNHMSTRLVRGWTHLERQKGGIGLRGPGETQLETDRRLLSERIKQLKKRLQKVKAQRQQNRRGRARSTVPTVSLIGYTNAGKSTLFNALSNANVYVQDQLFATLDPTLRRVELAHKQAMVLADTVGFIRHLPHDLVNAFHATLQETREADLLLHVIDSHATERDDHIQQVQDVIKMVGAEHVPQILVFNKIDLLVNDGQAVLEPRIDYHENGKPARVWLSAAQNQGVDLLKQAINQFFIRQLVEKTVILPPSLGKMRALLYEQTQVIEETCLPSGEIQIHFECTHEQYQLLLKQPQLQAVLSE